MQSRQSPHRDGLRESAPPSRRAQAAREALRRVTLELLQSQAQQAYSTQETYPLPGNISIDGNTTEPTSAQGPDSRSAEQKTRLLNAIQPVIEVVADSA